MDDILYQTRGAIAIITLNRPQTLNSLTRRMHQELCMAFDHIEANPSIRVAVLTGAGRGFCAGADLSEFDVARSPELIEPANPGPIIEEAFNPTIRKLQGLRVPTVAAVNGVAAGAGASLAIGCDIAIAAPQATFVQAFSRINLVPDAGGSWFLVHKVGLARAMGAALLGDKLTAAVAKDWGLIWDITGDGEDCVEAALRLATRLAMLPTQALVQTRKVLRAAVTNDLDPQREVERETQSSLGGTYDYIEGVRAFLQKRPAVFRGL